MDILNSVNVIISTENGYKRAVVGLDGEGPHGQDSLIWAGGAGADGMLIVRARDDRERLNFLGAKAALDIGGNGSNGSMRLIKTVNEGAQSINHSTMSFDSISGNFRAGGNGCDGDIALFPNHATNCNDFEQATIWMNSNSAGLKLGGNRRSGNLELFPESAIISTSETESANIRLEGEQGNVHISGGLIPKGEPHIDEVMPQYGIQQGIVASYRGSERYGLIDFTHHCSSSTSEERRKLYQVNVYNPNLHENSIVHLTFHAGARGVPFVGYLETLHEPSGGTGWNFNVKLDKKLSPGTHVRFVYWIMN